MKALDRKLVRDLRAIWAQALTIALVIACGTGGFIGSFATYESLMDARDTYYRDARFADLFAYVKRAPESVGDELRALPGVAVVQTRLVWDVQLDVPGVVQPVMGRFIGVAPREFERGLNGLQLRAGRLPAAGERDTVVINESFARARGLGPGSMLTAVLNGRLQTFTVTGVALSPEFIFATREGAMPDDQWFGVVWTDRERLAASLSMQGAFNAVSVRLLPGASESAVLAEMDRRLARYGSRGAFSREWQISHRIITQELGQWQVMGSVLPSFFLAVSVFVLNIVMSRLVTTQRDQVAALKAMGYSTAQVRLHYLELAAVIVALGLVLGIGVGWWMGTAVTGLYAGFFHFPSYRFALPPDVVALAWAITIAAGMAGTWYAVHATVSLSPAQAMRPAAPPEFRATLMERLGLGRVLGVVPKMIARSFERRPLRATVTVLGVAGSVAVLISGIWWRDAMDYLVDISFFAAQPADVQIGFVEPQAPRVVHDIRHLPGVMQAEGTRALPVKAVAGHRSVRTALQGVGPQPLLRRFLDAQGRPIPMPPNGVVMSQRLAQRLRLGTGDVVTLELLEGEPRQVELTLVGTVDDLMGQAAYVDLDELHRIAGDGPRVSGAFVTIDPRQRDEFMRATKRLPGVAFVWAKQATLQSFRDTSQRNLLFFTSILTAFAATIAVGVVYNSARIALAERAWELATLRVLGLSKREVSSILLGELAIELVVALPIGYVLGYLLAALLVAFTHPDTFRIPLIIWPRTYAYAGLTMLGAGLASAWLVHRRMDRLDMVAVLKTRE